MKSLIACISILLVPIIQPWLVSGSAIDAAEIVFERVVHSDSIDALCATEDDLISASFDGHIKRITADSVEEVGAHGDWVRGLCCLNDDIVSASNDGHIAIWKGAALSNQVLAHDWWITDIAYHDHTIISVSLDETVKIWSYPQLKLIYQHKIPGSSKHMTVAICQNKAFIGSTWSISVLDLSTLEWIYQNKAFDGFNVFLASTSSDHTVYFGDSSGKIFLFDASTCKLVSSLNVSRTAIKALAYHQGELFIGDDDGNIMALDADSPAHAVVLARHPQAVRVILVRDDTVYAGYDGGILRGIRLP